MHKTPSPLLCLIAVFAILLTALPPVLAVGAGRADEGEVLAAAESVFQHMQNREFAALWQGMTEASRRSTIRSVLKALDKAGQERPEEEIRSDFASGGALAREYWSAYLLQFNPKTVLEESRWRMGAVDGNRAEILIRYRKSNHDTVLKLFREGGAWRVGLDESFSTRQ